MLKLEQLSFQVPADGTNLEIIDAVDLEIPAGSFTVITGPNGGGKSTLARLIMGIEQPTGGRILFQGEEITHLSVTERAKRGIGYAFQQPPRFKGLTVRRLLSLAAGETLSEAVCSGYLTAVGLDPAEYLNREMDASLSGGEAKRVEIATLMARDLKLLIFDEPEAGIDLWSFSMLVESFRTLRQAERSVIVISHQERIMQLADTMVIIAGGRVCQSGTRDAILPKLLGEVDGRKEA